MKRLWFLISFILILGCQDVKPPEMPDDLIARDVMIDILTEAYISNAAKSVNNKIIRQRGIKLDSMIYAKYDIDSVQFVRSHAWYNSDLEGYKKMFIEIENRLTKLSREIDSIHLPKKSPIQQKQDSLRRAKGLIEPASD